jgi:hypothetical protein
MVFATSARHDQTLAPRQSAIDPTVPKFDGCPPPSASIGRPGHVRRVGERSMSAQHKFAVGQTVRFSPDPGQGTPAPEASRSFACCPNRLAFSNTGLRAS